MFSGKPIKMSGRNVSLVYLLTPRLKVSLELKIVIRVRDRISGRGGKRYGYRKRPLSVLIMKYAILNPMLV